MIITFQRHLHRDNDLGRFFECHDLMDEGAEIGVAHGGNSANLLRSWKGKKLYMIDIWQRQDSNVYREKTDDIDYEEWYQEAKGVAERDGRGVVVRKLSADAVSDFADGSLDFVYLDANHAYEFVKQDLDLWYPKIKNKGCLSGHDWGNDIHWPHYTQVEPAVKEFCQDHGLDLEIWGCDSWFTFKP